MHSVDVHLPSPLFSKSEVRDPFSGKPAPKPLSPISSHKKDFAFQKMIKFPSPVISFSQEFFQSISNFLPTPLFPCCHHPSLVPLRCCVQLLFFPASPEKPPPLNLFLFRLTFKTGPLLHFSVSRPRWSYFGASGCLFLAVLVSSLLYFPALYFSPLLCSNKLTPPLRSWIFLSFFIWISFSRHDCFANVRCFFVTVCSPFFCVPFAPFLFLAPRFFFRG